MNFVDPNMAPQKFRTDLVLADRDTKDVVSNKLRIVYLMLPLFKKRKWIVITILNVGFLCLKI